MAISTRTLLGGQSTGWRRRAIALVSLGLAMLATGPLTLARLAASTVREAPATGPLVATVRVGLLPFALAVDARRGHVFVVNDSAARGLGSVSMLDAATGRLLRTVPIGVVGSVVGVDSRAGRVFVLRARAGRGSVVVLDAASGRVVRTVRTMGVGDYPAGLAVDEQTGHAFAANSSGSVSMLDSATGRVLRTIPGVGAPLALDEQAGHLVTSEYDVASLVDARTGRVLGTTPIDGYVCAIAVDSRAGRAVVAVDRTTLPQPDSEEALLLDTRSGRVMGRTVLDEWTCGTFGPPVAVDAARGRAATVTCPDSQFLHVGACLVTLLDTRSGRALHGVRVGRIVPPNTANIPPSSVYAGGVAMDARRGLTFVTTLGGSTRRALSTVLALDTETGRVRAQIRVGRTPVALAVDEQRGRLFVANEDDGTVSVIDTTQL